MTLHEAIEQVLQDYGKPLSSAAIAAVVNEKQLYVRKDNAPVQATQISARTANYPNLFSRENGKVYLIQNDAPTLLFQRVRNEIVQAYKNQTHIKANEKIDLLKTAINKIIAMN